MNATNTSTHRRVYFLTIAVVVVVALAAHATALFGDFVWLDHAHLGDGGAPGLAIAPLSELGTLFTRGFAGTGFYRPFMALSLSLDAAVGAGPWLFHTTSLAWHAGAAALVVTAALALGLRPAAAGLAGLLFAVHPATSLVVGAIAFRSEAMLLVGLLALVRKLGSGLIRRMSPC